MTGQVAFNAAGMANYSISVKDLTGNVATPVTSTTSINLDTESPSLSDVVLSSSNTTNSSYAKAGDNLTLTFNASELIETPLVTLAGDNLSVQDTNSGAGTSWQAVYTVQDGDNGTVAFSIQYQDQAGNTDDNVTTTDLDNLINIDTAKPSVIPSSVTIASSNSVPAVQGLKLAKQDDSITFDFDTNEKVFSPILRLRGRDLFAFSRGSDSSGKLWTAEYVIPSDDDYLKAILDAGRIKLWLDAGNIDGSYNTTIADGVGISTWNDLSGSGNHVTQTNQTSFPTRHGHFVSFDGVNDYLWTETSESLNTATMVVVTRVGDLDFDGTNSGGAAVTIQQQSNDNFDAIVYHERSDADRKFMNGSSGFSRSSNMVSSVAETDEQQFVIIINQIKNQEFKIYRNGVLVAEHNHTSSQKPNTRFLIGNRHFTGSSTSPVSNGFWYGDIQEVLILDKELSASEREALNTVLSRKWGLETTVDSDGDGTMDSDEASGVQWAFQSMSDAAGNMLDTSTAPTVTGDNSKVEIDTIIPKLIVSVASDNDNISLAKAYDNVTLTVESSEALQTLELVKSDGSRESLVATDDSKTSWQYSRMVQAGESGVFDFRLEYSDPVGNQGAVITMSTDGSMVTLDTVVPDLTSYGVKVNDVSSFTAKSGDTLKVEFSTTETIRTPVVRIGGEDATVTGSGSSWIAEKQLGSSSSEGQVTVEMIITDASGNQRTLSNHESTDPLAFYSFTGNANDNSSHTNHLTVHGATLSSDRFGMSDSAYRFDGNDDYLTGGDVNDLGTESVAFSAWFKTSMQGWGSGNKILNKGLTSSGNNAGYHFRLGPDNHLQLELVKEIMARLIGLKFVPSTLSMMVIGTTPLE